MMGGVHTLDQLLRWANVLAWLFCLACLAPAVWRLMLRRARYLDPVWALIFLLSLNRLSFLLHVSVQISLATALVMAIAMGLFSRSYQGADHD